MDDKKSERNKTHRKKRVVFLIHPRDHSDLAERFFWTKFIPPAITDPVLSLLRGRFGFTVCEKIDVYGKLDLYLVAFLVKGHQMITNSPKKLRLVRKRIMQAIQFSKNNLKADVIGLGALTSSVTKGGKWIVDQNGLSPFITHGDTYASLLAVEGIQDVLLHSGISNPTIAIVGAYGIIGSALCKILSEKYNVIMIGRNKNKLGRLLMSINKDEKEVTTHLENMKKADIVVTTTSHPKSLLRSEYLKKGAIVYDVSQPANIDRKLLKERPDVLKIDGSLANFPSIDIEFNMRTGKGATFACLAEAILMGLENIKGHYVGEVDLAHMKRLKHIGFKYGFLHAPYTQFGKPIIHDQLLRHPYMK
jgi:predicted amino acid dehydrogenase